MQRPLGLVSLAAVALPMTAGAIVVVLARYVVFVPLGLATMRDGLDWTYLWASPAVALTGLVLACRAWWRRLWPFDAPHDTAPPPEWLWLALAAGCGAGLGFYAGALHHLELEVHVSAVFSHIVLLPLAMLAATAGASIPRGLARLAAMAAALELCVQVAHSLTQRGGLRYWSDLTGVNAGFVAGGCVLLVLLRVTRAAARVERLRPPPPDPAAEAAPRRA